MAINTDIDVERGRTQTIVVTVTGITDWTNYKGLFVAREESPDDPAEVVLSMDHDSIDDVNDKITFKVLYVDAAALTADSYDYEVILYKDDLSEVHTTTYGKMRVAGVVQLDPTESSL